MAVQEAIDKLKNEGSKEDKVAVAGSIAVFVVLVLLILWGIFFFRKIQRGTQHVDLKAGAQDEFNFKSVKDAQQRLQEEYSSSTGELIEIRNQSAAGQTHVQETMQQQTGGSDGNQFGTANGGQ